jgi:N-acetylglucosaminyltransferase
MDQLEIVAMDDCSKDDSYQYLEQAREHYGNRITIGRNPVNSGKHQTLLNASRHASGEVFICIDSDTIFDKNVIRELLACFCDPTVGAVGGSAGVRNVNDNLLTMIQAVMYFRSFHFMKLIQIVLKNVSCISGCLFAIRASIYREVEGDIHNNKFLGVPIRNGEDRYLTHVVALYGWRTIINPNAICWTTVPNKFWVLFSQQLRWTRSWFKDVLWTLIRPHANFKAVGVMRTMGWLIPSLPTVVVPSIIILIVAVYGPGVFIWMLGIGFLYATVTQFFYTCLYNWLAPKLMPGSKKISHPLLTIFASAWGPVMLVVNILGLLTLDNEAWGTRENVSVASQKPPSST